MTAKTLRLDYSKAYAASKSIKGKDKTRNFTEQLMKWIFIICGAVSILAVAAITIYMIIAGAPAIAKIGIKDMLFGTEWAPTAVDPKFGIFYIILTSIIGTISAVLIGVPIALFTAIFLSEVANKNVYQIIKPAVELLAGIPSVVYGLLGILIVKPVMYKLEMLVYTGDTSHQYTGGANLLSAVFVLTIMILPTIINVSENALRSVPQHIRSSSLALGATKIQTIFKVTVPCANSGIIAAIVLGVGRAIGEAMAITLVAGNVVNLPAPFSAVRFLTTGIVSEMAYSSGLHRQALFTIGLVLFIFIIVINIVLNTTLKKAGNKDE